MSGNLPQLPARYQPRVSGQLSLAPGALTHANSDDEIVALWLRRPNLSPRTVRNCRKEADRFILWIRAHQLELRAVHYEHLLAYAEFITDPQPAADWIAAGKWRRTDPRWRPFLGPLSPISQRQALVVLQSLFRWAHSADYLKANPAKLLGSMSVPAADEVTRFLPLPAMPFLQAAAATLPADKPAEKLRMARARFILLAYYLTAARLSELVAADMSNFRRNRHGQWWLHLVGKGNVNGKVPVPGQLLDELQAYRIAFGLPPLPSPREDTPLLLNTRGTKLRATSHPIARCVKLIMHRGAQLATEAGQGDLADQIAQASTHWLRHSSLTHQVDAGADLKTVQLNARHAKLSTTGLYLHKEDSRRHVETIAALEKHESKLLKTNNL